MKKFSLLFLSILMTGLILFVSPLSILANDNEEKSHFDMSLEELMDIKIVTAASFDQKVSEASAIIDVYTSEQIKDLGVDNLYEFLSFLPGIEVMETYYGYTDIQFRGILQAHYNNKSSLLLNGQPLYDEIISSYYLEQIPISSIEQIEIIRGPGSVLYGTNAYAGVINIITKDGQSMNGSYVSLKSGSFNTKWTGFAFGREKDGINLFFGGEYHESDGYEKSIHWDEDDSSLAAGYAGETPYGNRILGFYPDDPDSYEHDYVNLFTSIGYKNVTLNAIAFESNKDKFGIVPTLISTGEREVKGFGLNARFQKLFLDNKMLFKSIVWYDQIKKDERVNSYPPVSRAAGEPHDQQYGGQKIGFQSQLIWPLFDNVDLLSGIGFENSHADPYIFTYTDSISATGEPIQNLAANAFPGEKYTSDIWAFLQSTIHAVEKVDIQAGIRLNNNQQAGSVLIPSLGLVYCPVENLSVKCLYGVGFRNPSFFEKYVRTVDVLAGNENLEPERINTFEIGVDYTFLKYSIRANSFYTITDKVIERRSLTTQEVSDLNSEPGYGTGATSWTKGFVYYNSTGGTYQGIELTAQGRPVKDIDLNGNLTYKVGEDDDGNELKYFAPLHANLSTRYSPIDMLNFTFTVQYVSEREGNYAAQYAWQTWSESDEGGTDYTLDAYTLLNARVGFKPAVPIEISLIIKNILNVEYFYPEYIRRSIPYIPGGPERSFFVEIGYSL